MKHFITNHFIAVLLIVPAVVISLLAVCFGQKHEKIIGLTVIVAILAFTVFFPIVDSALSQIGLNQETRLILSLACVSIALLVRKKRNKPN